MNRTRVFPVVLGLSLAMALAVSCAPKATPGAGPRSAPTSAPAVQAVQVEKVEVVSAEPQKAPEAPREAPKPQEGGAAPAAQEESASGKLADLLISPQSATRKIIKDGEMNLMVNDVDRAIDQVTRIALDSGGYVLNSNVDARSDAKSAMMKMGVPAEAFEDVMRQVRAIAARVISETSSGKDVTEEYVDLQSQLTNLEATAERLREFLKSAKTVEEALKVNEKLAEIEGEIEQVKGRMNYLRDRAAYSTLTVVLEQVMPTPTVTPTPTTTSTPTATPTSTPVAWYPGETFESAGSALGTVSRGVGNVLIWLLVFLVPLAAVAALIAVPIVLVRRRRRSPTP
jgi:hypothetical protein